jgi:hypothetical protein
MLDTGECRGIWAVVVLRDRSHRLDRLKISIWGVKNPHCRAPSEGKVENKFLPPGPKVRSPEKETFGIIEIGLWTDTKELVHKRAMPCMIVSYVIR